MLLMEQVLVVIILSLTIGIPKLSTFYQKIQSYVYCIAFDNRSGISSVGRALDCRAGGIGFDSRDRTKTGGLKITEK